MSKQAMKTKVARAAVAVVVGFGVSVGSAVTFAPPAHADSKMERAQKEMQRFAERLAALAKYWEVLGEAARRAARI